MVLPPFSSPLGFLDCLHPQDQKEECWFIFSGDQLLISEDKTSLHPYDSTLIERTLFVGTFQNQNVFVGELALKVSPYTGFRLYSLRELFGHLKEEYFAIAGRALHLLEWERTHTYCGCCGSKTHPCQHERSRQCISCNAVFYPRLNPVVMVLVKKENKILLVRGHDFRIDFYSTIAGFVDVGETLEQAVEREVFEEVGIKIKNIRYFASQPWPFSHSLMTAFTCDWESGEIQIDPKEITDAAWFEKQNLPRLPSHISLSRILIDAQINP